MTSTSGTEYIEPAGAAVGVPSTGQDGDLIWHGGSGCLSDSTLELPTGPGASAVPVDAVRTVGIAKPSPARSVLANWIGHAVAIVSGFILPRFINDHIGQVQLGIWDLGWSTVSYLNLLMLGMASSVNRYIAKYEATNDWVELNKFASASACIFICTGMVAVGVTAVLVLILPAMLPSTFAGHIGDVQWLVGTLGLACAIGMPMATYNGIITGNQRYGIAMVIEALCTVTLLVSILVLLKLGYGLRSMGMAALGKEIVEGILKWRASHRICPELRLSVRCVTRPAIRDVFNFGVKSFLGWLGRTSLYQGSSLLVGLFLGPAFVAVLARSMVLVNHADKALVQFARVLIPLASSAQARNEAGELSGTVLNGARWSLLLSLPISTGLVVFAKPLMRVWMGQEYASLPLLAILAATHFVSLSQTGPICILTGLNRHGIAGLAGVVGAGLSLLVSLLLLTVFHAGLTGVAISIGACEIAANIVMVPLIVHASEMSIRRYIFETVPGALLSATPFLIWIVTIRLVLAGSDKLSLLVGMGGGSIVLIASYWMTAIPQEMKLRILKKCGVHRTVK